MTCIIRVQPLNGDTGEEHVGKTFLDCVRQMFDCFEASESPDWCMWAFMPAVSHFSALIYEGETQGTYQHKDMSGDWFDVSFEIGEEA